MTTVVISQPMLFPWRGMFEQVALADVFVHYDDAQFSKGSFTNRVQLKTATGVTWMTVPLRKFHLGETIDHLEANDEIDWRDQHLRLLADAYRRAPYVDDAVAFVRQAYARSGSLAQMLMQSTEDMAARLGLGNVEFARTSDLGIDGSASQRVLDIVLRFGGSTYVTGHGARGYLDVESFEAAGVDVQFMDYRATPYPQCHGDFTPYVSVLDLVANTGPAASAALEPVTVGWRSFLGRE